MGIYCLKKVILENLPTHSASTIHLLSSQITEVYLIIYNCERSELSNPGSILTMRVCMYVSVTLRNVAVTSRRNVASMMRIRTPSIIYARGPCTMYHTQGRFSDPNPKVEEKHNFFEINCSYIIIYNNYYRFLKYFPLCLYEVPLYGSLTRKSSMVDTSMITIIIN